MFSELAWADNTIGVSADHWHAIYGYWVCLRRRRLVMFYSHECYIGLTTDINLKTHSEQ
jgi:hypothetical protein